MAVAVVVVPASVVMAAGVAGLEVEIGRLRVRLKLRL